MNDRPGALDLIETARDTFTNAVLPTLSGELRYTALMIANAMGIALREIDAAHTPLRAEWWRLCKLFGESSPPPGGTALHRTLAHYNQRLVRAIRAGRFDGEERAAMMLHLRRTTEEKLAVSSPKAIRERGAAAR